MHLTTPRTLAGLGALTLALLLTIGDTDGQPPGHRPPPPRNITSPTFRPSSMMRPLPPPMLSPRPFPPRPGMIVTKPPPKKYRPYHGLPKASNLPRPYSAPIEGPKSLLRTAPKLGLASYSYRPALTRSAEWDLVPLVLEGRVQSLRRATREGKVSSAGPRLHVSLSVGRILKGGGVSAGELLALRGWASGELRQEFVPSPGEEVIAFLRSPRNGRLELLGRHGFQRRSASPVRRSTASDDPLDVP